MWWAEKHLRTLRHMRCNHRRPHGVPLVSAKNYNLRLQWTSKLNRWRLDKDQTMFFQSSPVQFRWTRSHRSLGFLSRDHTVPCSDVWYELTLLTFIYMTLCIELLPHDWPIGWSDEWAGSWISNLTKVNKKVLFTLSIDSNPVLSVFFVCLFISLEERAGGSVRTVK